MFIIGFGDRKQLGLVSSKPDCSPLVNSINYFRVRLGVTVCEMFQYRLHFIFGTQTFLYRVYEKDMMLLIFVVDIRIERGISAYTENNNCWLLDDDRFEGNYNWK